MIFEAHEVGKMRILQVTSTYVPSKFGGTKVVSYNLSKALAREGYEVTVYTTDANIGSRLTKAQMTNNISEINAKYFKNLSNFLAVKHRLFLPVGIVPAIRRDITNFDIIHLHDFRGFHNIIIHHYAKKYDIPYILDAHGSIPQRSSGERGFKWLLRWLFNVAFGNRILRDASRCIAETEVGIGEYKDANVNYEKIVLITPPFPVDEFSQLPPRGLFRNKYNIKQKHIVMFLGRVNWIKGIDFLVESFYELAKDRDDVILVIVGPDDGYMSSLEELIDRLNLSHKVLFTGFLTGNDKLSALVDADAVVQTSRYEQGAWAPFEAILCNTPIIVSSNSGAGEDVRNVDAGYLVEWGNKMELKDAMIKTLDDPTEVMNKTQKAKEYIITNLSMEKNMEKYIMVYMDCIQ